MSSLLVIPSASLVPAELQGDFGRIPSCMIPFGGAPALRRILDGYSHSDVRAIVACHASHAWVEDFLSHSPQAHVRSLDVGPTRSLGETVFRALGEADSCVGSLVVHFGDTLVKGQLAEGDGFFFNCPGDLYRWTTFHLAPSGYIDQILDKGVEKGDTADGRVFVGVFSFSDGRRFQSCLQCALAIEQPDLDPFYRALQDYYNASEQPPRAQEAELWIDLGHLDTYYASRQVHAMGQRAFNAVSVDPFRGILTKQSRNEEKFADEIRWYLKLPPSLRYLAPRVFEHTLVSGEMRIVLEFYGYPPLSDIFLFSRLDLSEWQAIFFGLRQVLDDMGKHRIPPEDHALVPGALRSIYLDKTLERLQQLDSMDIADNLKEGPLWVNGEACCPLQDVLKTLPEDLERVGLFEAPPFTVVHGDFCLSNILFDRRSKTVRLVDPRGRFGAFDIHGDPRYDLAKLSHSFNGGYDFLLQGLFSMECATPGCYRLDVFMDDRHRAVRDRFNDIFLPDFRAQLQVRAIEALLFLSMVPLHADRPRSQEAFLLRGLELATAFLAHPAASFR